MTCFPAYFLYNISMTYEILSDNEIDVLFEDNSFKAHEGSTFFANIENIKDETKKLKLITDWMLN